MPRIVLGGIAAAILFLLPATAHGDSAVHVRGVVAGKSAAQHLVRVRAERLVVGLRVRNSLARIRLGQRVELRGSTLRASGRKHGVLASNVTIVSSTPLAQTSAATPDDDPADDETEVDDDDQNTGPGSVDDDDGDDDVSGATDDDTDDDDDGGTADGDD